MINREWQPVRVYTFISGLDEYGQVRQKGNTYSNELMVIKPFSLTNTDNPLFIDVELIALTKNRSIGIQNMIMIDDIKYNILKVIETKQYNQLFLKKNG